MTKRHRERERLQRQKEEEQARRERERDYIKVHNLEVSIVLLLSFVLVMAEEFQTGICGGNWWMNSSRSPFPGSSSPCYAWSDMVDMKGRPCEETNSVSDSSIVFQDAQKPQQQADSASGSNSILIDSTLQMMGFGLSSSSTSDWNHQALM